MRALKFVDVPNTPINMLFDIESKKNATVVRLLQFLFSCCNR
jgi:hypothetical protein